MPRPRTRPRVRPGVDYISINVAMPPYLLEEIDKLVDKRIFTFIWA